jgi:hypothetical protein
MFKRISDPAFDIDAPVLKDESVRDYQYYSFDARTPNDSGRTELQVHDTSRHFLPAEAFIEVEGEILKTDNTANEPMIELVLLIMVLWRYSKVPHI